MCLYSLVLTMMIFSRRIIWIIIFSPVKLSSALNECSDFAKKKIVCNRDIKKIHCHTFRHSSIFVVNRKRQIYYMKRNMMVACVWWQRTKYSILVWIAWNTAYNMPLYGLFCVFLNLNLCIVFFFYKSACAQEQRWTLQREANSKNQTFKWYDRLLIIVMRKRDLTFKPLLANPLRSNKHIHIKQLHLQLPSVMQFV